VLDIEYYFKSSNLISGVFYIDRDSRDIYVDHDMLYDLPEDKIIHLPERKSDLFFIVIKYDSSVTIDIENDISISLPLELRHYGPIRDSDNNIIIIIEDSTGARNATLDENNNPIW